MSKRRILRELTEGFNQDRLNNFFRNAHPDFRPIDTSYPEYVAEEPDFLEEVTKVGEIEFDLDEKLLVFQAKTTDDITEKTSKKRQYDLAKRILTVEFADAGIFVFHDERGHFRFSLVVTHYVGTSKKHTPFRRYTYYVDPDKPNKTFLNQIGKADFSGINSILKAFSIEEVSEEFYNDFKPHFDKIAQNVQGTDVSEDLKQDFALLFIIRVIFLGFVQKKKWLGSDEEFLQKYWEEYKTQFEGDDRFYNRWLKPLFFDALNSKPGTKVKYQNNEFTKETKKALQMAPFLNGDLFKEKKGYDDIGLMVPDKYIGDFFDFLFQYNFTIEENQYYDEDLELNPEFLGLIFERLVNKEDGAVYTPRTEVDFMCRMSLVKWLEKNTSCEQRDLYRLFFREMGTAEEYDKLQKQGDFSQLEIKELIAKLENVTACDPAAGSGAFEVGMMHVLYEVLNNLYNRPNRPPDIEAKSGFELKESIIAQSLYGVEVKEWAVWINHLRLWLTLFIDMPDKEKNSLEPLLPSLNFKVRCGDSLVQRIGSKLFPVQGHAHLSSNMKRRITNLKKKKIAFFNNQGVTKDEIEHAEFTLFRDIVREEIEAKQEKINILENKKVDQTKLDLDLPEPAEPQQKMELYAEKKKRLQQEIEELQEQEQNLAESHPLVWNIEFAEIFYDHGGFDIIIGNPPYVEGSKIEDPTGKLSSKEYKDCLEKLIYQDFPAHFNISSRKISRRSNLYLYFYIRSLNLLNDNGYHIFICQNSWLDVEYGVWFQKFLLQNVQMPFIYDNQITRSFSTAGVNTVITLMSSVKDRIDNNFQYKFVAFKRPFEEVILTNNLLDLESIVEWKNNKNYRVYPKPVSELIDEGSKKKSGNGKLNISSGYTGNKWGGKYLRMPKFLYDLFKRKKAKFIPFESKVDISYGVKSGKVKFFYLNEQTISDFNIESDFYRSIIKSSKDLDSIFVNGNSHIFSSGQSQEELKGTNALDYIKWGEEEDLNKGASVEAHNPYWYSLDLKDVDVLFFRFFNERFFTPIIEDGSTCSDNFCYGLFKEKEWIGKAFVNSTFYFLQIECFGRVNQGEGVLNMYKNYDYPFIKLVDFSLFKDEEMKRKLEKLSKRSVQNIFTECGIDPESSMSISEQKPVPLPDRAELDNIVFDALGLSQEERKEVYRAVCQLVWNRVSKAKSV